ncbi:MAG: efflux RND transporter periplasmic adaptor subunit [Aquificaceae bacterium]
MVWMLLIPLVVFANLIKVNEDTIQKLGIKTQSVKIEEARLEDSLPAVLKSDPSLSVEIYSLLEGVIKRLYVKEGDRVKKGQILAEIYSPRIAEINSQIRVLEVKLKKAQEVLKREELLYKEEVIPYAKYFSAKVEYETALAEYKAMLQNRSSLGEIREDNLIIRSPYSGVVLEQKAVLNSSVGLQSPLFKIQDYSRLWAYAYAEPSYKPKREGYVVWEEKQYSAKLEWISPKLDPQTGKLVLRFLVENKDYRLKEGLRVNIKAKGQGVQGFWLPAQAVQEVRGDSVVFVRVRDGFLPKKVKKLRQEGNRVLVEGLSQGDLVAIEGTIFLKSQVEK